MPEPRLSFFVCRWVVSFLSVFLIQATLAEDLRAENRKRIFLIETMPVPVVIEHSKWFLVQMKELGYREGENADIVVLEAQGDRRLAETLLKSHMSRGLPDIVVTNATMATQTAVNLLAGTGIPIVFMTVSDPVGGGFVKEIGTASGANITSIVHMIDRQTRLGMVMPLLKPAAAPKPVRIGFIHSSYPSAVGDLRELSTVAGERGDVVFNAFPVSYRTVPEGLPAMLEETLRGIREIDQMVDYWWEPSGPLGEVVEYTQALLDHSTHPILMGTKLKSVEMGALLHLTPSTEGSGREAAFLTDAILHGADPGKIPITPPKTFELGLNLSTAIDMNIVIPPDLLELAGDQLYR